MPKSSIFPRSLQSFVILLSPSNACYTNIRLYRTKTVLNSIDRITKYTKRYTNGDYSLLILVVLIKYKDPKQTNHTLILEHNNIQHTKTRLEVEMVNQSRLWWWMVEIPHQLITCCKHPLLQHLPTLAFYFQTTFNAPDGNEPLALDMNGMGKGHIWLIGEGIERHWPAYKTSGKCDKWSYTGQYIENKCNR